MPRLCSGSGRGLPGHSASGDCTWRDQGCSQACPDHGAPHLRVQRIVCSILATGLSRCSFASCHKLACFWDQWERERHSCRLRLRRPVAAALVVFRRVHLNVMRAAHLRSPPPDSCRTRKHVPMSGHMTIPLPRIGVIGGCAWARPLAQMLCPRRADVILVVPRGRGRRANQ